MHQPPERSLSGEITEFTDISGHKNQGHALTSVFSFCFKPLGGFSGSNPSLQLSCEE